MNTFQQFLNSRYLMEAAPAAPPTGAAPPSDPSAGGISTPGSLPPGGGMGGMGMAPPMGGMGMGGMGMGGMMPPSGAPQAAPNKLKAYNVWDVLERVLGDDGQNSQIPQE